MWQEVIYPVAFVLLVLLPAPLLGSYIYRVFEGKSRWLSPIERATLACCGTDGREQDWKSYALSLLAFNGAGFGLLFLILMAQGLLPLNPQQLPGLNWELAFNTAVSFMTNTNWQAYSGEASLSYFSQMVGLTTQNFVSAGTGAAVAVALFRGISRQQTIHLGNFWQDLVRFCLYVLLPLALIMALLLVWQGVPQSLSAYLPFHSLEGQEQLLPLGPAASQIAIKQLGSNGGGFFGVNSAHPFENPTALSNWLEMVTLLTIPAALVCTLGRYVKDTGHGRAILTAMALLFVLGLCLSLSQEMKLDPNLADITSQAGNWEGKESRFGPVLSSIWEVATTAASNGAVNSMHDSFTPLGGMVGMINMLLGEVIFGGVGSGIYGMMLFVLLTVFLCGLMVGRTPTYLGKRLGITEMKWVVASMLVMPVGVLVLGGVTLLMPDASTIIGHEGPHGLSRLIYAYASAAGNNGSAFAGLAAADSWQCIAIGLAMLLGRFGYIIPVLAIAGQLARAPRQETGEGDFPIRGPLFITLLIITVLLIGGLSFLPVLALGPVAEHLSLMQGAF
ncbi:TPA: potassium-transporting ATPase subunit KdpA [Aeromonas salmonicida subsp. smithia]|uniref:Potassium-transporting ATPase potassium-binding subunit n=2 Tax=Aeromonas salmonicida TaxID=645 RepID=A0AAX3VRI9_AERSA|nr:potassium-transporting ATPase subunit KdpA [Aeromonas salmonicida]KTA75286.1 ATPase [Aeromonas salmonicida]MDF8328906.1 potassium-transporting ATPase subunit KdpA [Aeromonas salmonicida]RSM23085.1 potassium-transporting ATPase subunit KdpA [Aeromonas salmonicida]RSM27713.1 potassium-transporting ATPase subunit KdpA [Aeromonas salmonicida]WHF35463.1 potassium-transporting ATPase subunit KdpA [Aeromonas salmonicida]